MIPASGWGMREVLLAGCLCEHQIPFTADTHFKAGQSKCTLADDPKVLYPVEEEQVSLVLRAERVKVSSARDEKTTAN